MYNSTGVFVLDGAPMKSSGFRAWLQNIWMENKDEHAEFHELAIPLSEYIRRYKWWLKREYRQRVDRD